MSESAVTSVPLPEFPLWDKMKNRRVPISFTLEVTARCNNDCRHCFINLPAGNKKAKERELSFEEIKGIVDEATALGAVWCLITGGEPLLRDDFFDIYMLLKKKGFLLSVFTNATLITEEHIRLFKKYPPRDIEVSVYGATEETYERVTRRRGSFASFMRGVDLLIESGIKVRFKAMALRSNVHEMAGISRFCRERTKDFFRFDPFLHLRYDRDPVRNEEIKSERLSPQEIVELEKADPERFQELKSKCDDLIVPEFTHATSNNLFLCGVGAGSFVVSYDGFFHLCSSLRHPDCIFDLKKGSLVEAWRDFVPRVRAMKSNRKEYLENCRTCPLIDICLWCPAHAYLESGEMDTVVDYFCEVAHARAELLTKYGTK